MVDQHMKAVGMHIKAVGMLIEAAMFGALLVGVIYTFRLIWFEDLIVAVGTVIAAALIHFRWKKPFRPSGVGTLLVYLLFLGVFGGTQVGLWKGFTNVKKTATFQMTWSYAEPLSEWPDCKHIVLTFVEYPDHQIGIVSNDLGEYVESLSEPTVAVQFETTWDFGKLRGYHATKIGDRTDWHSAWEYGALRLDRVPFPWDSI